SSMACGAVHRQTPEAGARCVNRARRDLCGGYPVTGIPTATVGCPYVGMWHYISCSEDRRENAGLSFGVVEAPAY
ncbi:hypothetical protein FIB16_14810, partial [Klebsiella pneumoniae]